MNRRQLSKIYAKDEAAFTRAETKAIQNATTQVDTSGKRWTVMILGGTPVKMAVKITVRGQELRDPLTKSQRRDLRGCLGLTKSETL